MLVDHPSVVARIAPKALSPQGRLEAVKPSFWNGMRFATSADLALIWKEREQLKFSEQHWVACAMGEAAAGDLLQRSWGSEIPQKQLPAVLTLALASAPSLILRLPRRESPTPTGVTHTEQIGPR